jgi:hypothetical protein
MERGINAVSLIDPSGDVVTSSFLFLFFVQKKTDIVASATGTQLLLLLLPAVVFACDMVVVCPVCVAVH